MALAAIHVEKTARSANIHVESSSETFESAKFFLSYLNAHNRLFERALHAELFTLMAAKAINAHQCFALSEHGSLCNGL